MKQSHANARQWWARIALQSFPHRHAKGNVGNNARAMLKSLFAHGRAFRKFEAEILNKK